MNYSTLFKFDDVIRDLIYCTRFDSIFSRCRIFDAQSHTEKLLDGRPASSIGFLDLKQLRQKGFSVDSQVLWKDTVGLIVLQFYNIVHLANLHRIF